MTTPTTPTLSLEDRVTILETRLDAVLPTLATKEDIARLEGKIAVANEPFENETSRLERKIDAAGDRLFMDLSIVVIAITAIGIVAVKYL